MLDRARQDVGQFPSRPNTYRYGLLVLVAWPIVVPYHCYDD
jgi:hypothetical protein